MDKKLSGWASIAEITSSIAILVTLIFLVVETRQNNELIEQNTKAVQWTAIHQLNETVMAVSRDLNGNPENSALLARAHESYDDLTEEEKQRCKGLIGSVFLNLDIFWWAYQDGLLPEHIWNREESALRFFAVTSSCGREQWPDTFLSQPFREYVETELIGN